LQNKTVQQKGAQKSISSHAQTRQQHQHHLNDIEESPCLLTPSIWWSLQKEKSNREHKHREKG